MELVEPLDFRSDELNHHVYSPYELSPSCRATVERRLGEHEKDCTRLVVLH